jgi:hypothetical protein
MKRTLASRVLLFPCLVALLFTGPGCVTPYVVHMKAQDHPEYDQKLMTNVDVSGQPAYYALVPFTVVADILLLPYWIYCDIHASITGQAL